MDRVVTVAILVSIGAWVADGVGGMLGLIAAILMINSKTGGY